MVVGIVLKGDEPRYLKRRITMVNLVFHKNSDHSY